ncbi:baseplate protein [Leptolyngbya sp. 'hensonii']|nr:baseplate protein [Leptolyngbya sp. 'hensonii']
MNQLPSRSYLGTGLGFPLQVNVRGNLQFSSGEQNVEESIRIILGTTIGERASRPDFGSLLANLTFAPMNTDTLVMLCMAVEDALIRWEPRIILDDVQAEPDPVRGRVDLTIQYHYVDSYDPRTMVFPFSLRPEAEAEV